MAGIFWWEVDIRKIDIIQISSGFRDLGSRSGAKGAGFKALVKHPRLRVTV